MREAADARRELPEPARGVVLEQLRVAGQLAAPAHDPDEPAIRDAHAARLAGLGAKPRWYFTSSRIARRRG